MQHRAASGAPAQHRDALFAAEGKVGLGGGFVAVAEDDEVMPGDQNGAPAVAAGLAQVDLIPVGGEVFSGVGSVRSQSFMSLQLSAAIFSLTTGGKYAVIRRAKASDAQPERV